MIQCKYHEDMIRGVQYTFMYVHMYIHGGGGMSNVCMYIHEGCTAYVHMYMRGGQCIMKMVHVLGGGGGVIFLSALLLEMYHIAAPCSRYTRSNTSEGCPVYHECIQQSHMHSMTHYHVVLPTMKHRSTVQACTHACVRTYQLSMYRISGNIGGR